MKNKIIDYFKEKKYEFKSLKRKIKNAERKIEDLNKTLKDNADTINFLIEFQQKYKEKIIELERQIKSLKLEVNNAKKGTKKC